MLGDLDPLDFLLAEGLGKTLGEIRALPNAEVVEWRAFYKYRSEMEKLARG
jgi:hypothetical protein